MVSKGKILGKPVLVFVSVGSTTFPFDRLFSTIDHVVNTRLSPYFLIVQEGNSRYVWQYKNIKQVKYLSPQELINCIKKADKIIIQGGPATIYLTVKNAKYLPLIIPRQSAYKEHVNGHQLLFVEYLKHKLPKNIRKYFLIEKNIETPIKNYLEERKKINTLNSYIFKRKKNNNLIIKIKKYLKEL